MSRKIIPGIGEEFNWWASSSKTFSTPVNPPAENKECEKAEIKETKIESLSTARTIQVQRVYFF